MVRVVRFALLVLWVACLLPAEALAQGETTSAIVGQVRDTTNSVVPGAIVTITNPDTGLRRSAKTDDLGRFNFPQLKPGTYSVKVEAPGFEPRQNNNVVSGLGQKQTVGFTLGVALKNGTLNRIDPSTNSVRQKISIPSGSYNPFFSNGIVWVTGVESNVLTAVDAATGKVLESVSVGPKPRFLTSGGGSIWTLNQGDGTVSRVDEKSRKVTASIQVGIPGTGGDIGYGADSVWPTVFEVPLTRIDATPNKVVKQWVGRGGDSLRVGFGSIWITDYKRGLLERIPIQRLLTQ